MDNHESEALRRALLLERAITSRLDTLIKRATDATLLLDGNRAMEVGQLRNLLNTAVESRGQIEVVVNFIRYQIARNDYAWGKAENSFGQRVIKDLRGPITTLARDVAKEVAAELGAGADSAALEKSALARLSQLYLGYLHRTFYFARRVGSFASLKEVSQ